MFRNADAAGTKATRRAAVSGLASVALAGLVAACGSGGAGGYRSQPAQQGAGQQPAAAHGPVVTARKLPGRRLGARRPVG